MVHVNVKIVMLFMRTLVLFPFFFYQHLWNVPSPLPYYPYSIIRAPREGGDSKHVKYSQAVSMTRGSETKFPVNLLNPDDHSPDQCDFLDVFRHKSTENSAGLTKHDNVTQTSGKITDQKDKVKAV